MHGLLDSQLLLARAGLRQHDERKRASQLAAGQFPTSATDGFRLATVGLGQRHISGLLLYGTLGLE